MAERDPLRTLIDDYLEAHQRLQTPVASFAAQHAAGHALAPQYRDLIPLSAPGKGEQYAFEVDLDRCTGCKSCVAGCHSLNGLDEHETWRDVGVIFGQRSVEDPASPGAAYQQTITSACHHCADPGCLNGCPVLAYEKDPLTGIVRHLDDQCIGCQYCVLKCPYDVPKYNERLGIVRKCDMCHGRLAAGEAPACVQACPTQAIRIVKVQVTATPAPKAETSRFLAAAPDPGYTQPTTRYVSKRPIPQAAPGDADALRVQHTHLPLVFMLVLTQAGLGLGLGGWLAPLTGAGETAWTFSLSASEALVAGVVLFVAGIAASVAHLGQPMRAWRVFLNLRRSWLSREAVLLGASAGLLVTGFAWDKLGLPFGNLARGLVAGGWIAGLAGILCSAMLYIDTRRRFWAPPHTAARFGGTLLVSYFLVQNPALAAVLLCLKLALECWSFTRPANLPVTRRLLTGPLRGASLLRLALGLVALPSLFAGETLAALPFFIAGELLERTLFFRAVDAPKMPGVPEP